MINILYDKASDIDEATVGIELALSAIELALCELNKMAKLINTQESITTSINILHLSYDRIFDENKKLEIISEEMYSAAKTMSGLEGSI